MRKKIGIVATVPFALQAFMRAHIVMLAEQNEVTLITRGNEQELQPLLGDHVHFININVTRNVSLLTDFHVLISLYFIFKKNHFDLVHSIMPKTGLLAMLAAYAAGSPNRLHTFTGQVWANKVGLARCGLKMMDKVVAFCATALLADSFSQRAYLIAQHIVDEQKITVLGSGSICGVDVIRFQHNEHTRKLRRAELGIAEQDIVFLFLGRVNQDKGLQDLAQAFISVNKELPHTHLLVVGPDEGGMDLVLQNILAPCPSHFHRIGFTAKPEDYMSCSDVLCLPSYREGFGSVIIEAAAVGLPAIASNIYGLTDAVQHGETGILHEVKNTEQIREAMVLLATDNVLRHVMSTQAYERAHSYFSQEIVVNEMRQYYQ